MLIDAELNFGSGDFAEQAGLLEREGYAGGWAAETGHDPLLILAGAARGSTTLELGTGIVVAFGRSPMITATMANDVQLLSRGRLLLGLGSQIKPHIEKRYSMPWSRPAARMREYILAMRAIWASWNEGTRLRFRGEFYTHTLMTPFFNPGPNPYGAPKVYLAAVGELMTEVAGEVCDGLLVHPFTSERYLRDVTFPALERGMNRSGRDRKDFTLSYSGLIATGATDQSQEEARAAVRKQVAFYASTPAYRGVLEMHGWGKAQSALNALSREGRWDDMGALVSDEMLDAFSVATPVDDVASVVQRRFGDLIDRFSIYTPYPLEAEARSQVVSQLRQR